MLLIYRKFRYFDVFIADEFFCFRDRWTVFTCNPRRVNTICNYAQFNHLKLNISKSNFLSVSRRHHHYICHSTASAQQDQTRFCCTPSNLTCEGGIALSFYPSILHLRCYRFWWPLIESSYRRVLKNTYLLLLPSEYTAWTIEWIATQYYDDPSRSHTL